MRKQASYINGDRVVSEARSIIFKKTDQYAGHSYKHHLFKVNAQCFVAKRLSLLPEASRHLTPPTDRISHEAAMLHGEAIISLSRDCSRIQVIPKTSTHKIQRCTLKGDCLCVIRRELSGLSNPV
jgi:hypothetical protein